ncbi:MAG: hypothetical protein JO293_00010 [Candidatus Eremiobacteraeota bacterium]|nr:hypothetical protein [Candidatus Eremiobacteraeota bacterium]
MAAHSFAGTTGKKEPYTVQAARMLLYLEAALLLLSGLFAAAIGVLLGSSNSIPFANLQVSGAGAVVLGIFYGALGFGAVYIAVELRRLLPWTRTGAVVLQAALIVLFLARGNLSPSTALSVALCLAVAGLLLTPSAGAALTAEPAASQPASGGTATTPAATPAASPSSSGRTL